MSIGAIGEGWHNWHHKYPYDYAASEFGVMKQFNPTKLFIDTCCVLGLASECKRATGAWSKLKMKKELDGRSDKDSIGDGSVVGGESIGKKMM